MTTIAKLLALAVVVTVAFTFYFAFFAGVTYIINLLLHLGFGVPMLGFKKTAIVGSVFAIFRWLQN